ncbi:MAG: 3-isopropylmalate dehydratase large subunit, partial [uncultured bacterium]
ADIVSGKKIKGNIMAKIVPATGEVYQRMIETGVLQTLFNAGFIIASQGCGGCASGQIGMTGKNEVQISTSNRNFDGKQGDGKTYLTSPVVAAYSALNGYISYE